MVNKQNIALAIGKIEEMLVAMKDLCELTEGVSIAMFPDEPKKPAQLDCYSIKGALESLQYDLKEAMNEN